MTDAEIFRQAAQIWRSRGLPNLPEPFSSRGGFSVSWYKKGVHQTSSVSDFLDQMASKLDEGIGSESIEKEQP